VLVKDYVPNDTTYNGGATNTSNVVLQGTAPAVGAAAGTLLTWKIGTIPANSEVTVEFKVKVTANADKAERVIKNKANVDGKDTNLVEHPQKPGEPYGTKTAEPPHQTTVYEDDVITYTIHVFNDSPEPAHDVIVEDAIPNGTTYDSGITNDANVVLQGTAPAAGAAAGTALKWVVKTVPANSSVDIVFKVKVGKLPKNLETTGREITNKAKVNGIWTEEVIHPQYGFVIEGKKYASPPSGRQVYENGLITYFIDVTNNGFDKAQNIVVTDYVPENATLYVSTTDPTTGGGDGTTAVPGRPSSWGAPTNTANIVYTGPTTDGATGKLTWVIKDLGVDETVTIQFTVKASEIVRGKTSQEVVNDQAYVNATHIQETTHYIVKDLLRYSKSADPKSGETVQEYQNITYTVHVENRGDIAALDVYVTDPVPEEVEVRGWGTSAWHEVADKPGEYTSAYISDGGTYNPTTRTITWVVDEIYKGDSFDLSFEVTVKPFTPEEGKEDQPLEIINTAFINGKETNRVYHYAKKPVIKFEKTSSPASSPWPATGSNKVWVRDGEDIWYTIRVWNAGSYADSNIEVKDDLDEDIYFDYSDPQSVILQKGTWDYLNTVTGIKRITWNIPTLAPGEVVTLAFKVLVKPRDYNIVDEFGHEQAVEIENFATVYAYDIRDGEDTNHTLHYVYDDVLSGLKTSEPVSGSEVRSGDRITYTVTITNHSSEDALWVPVWDKVPEYTTPDKASAQMWDVAKGEYVSGGSYNDERNRFEWVIPKIAGQDSYTVRFSVWAGPLPDTEPRDIYNSALYGTGGTKDNPGTPTLNTNTVVHTVVAPKITPHKSAALTDGTPLPSGKRVFVGQQIVYTLTIHNNDSTKAINVHVWDEIPKNASFIVGTDYVSNVSDYNGRHIPGTAIQTERVDWVIPEIPANGDVEVKFSVTVNALQGTAMSATIVNTGYASNGGSTDPNRPDSGRNPTETLTHIVNWPPVEAEKTAVPATGRSNSTATQVEGGSVITYYIKVTNPGDQTLHDIQVHDDIPSGAYMDDSSKITGGGEYDFDSNRVSWTIATLEPGAENAVTLSFEVRTDTITAADGEKYIRNYAVVNNESTEPTVHKLIPADVYGEKSSPNAFQRVQRGETINYTIEVYNNSSTAKANVVVTDLLPVELINPQNKTEQQGSTFSANGNQLQWVITTLAPSVNGAPSFTIKFTAQVDPSLMFVADRTYAEILNSAIVDGKETNEIRHFVIDSGGIWGYKTTAPGYPGFDEEVKTDDIIAYSIVVGNSFQVPQATPIKVNVTDKIPVGTAYYTDDTHKPTMQVGTGTPTEVDVTMSGGSGAANTVIAFPEFTQDYNSASVTLTFYVKVQELPNGYTTRRITNYAIYNGHETNPVWHNQRTLPLEFSKTSNPPSGTATPLRHGAQITYTITVTNPDSAAATGVVVSDPLPAGTTLAEIITAGGTVSTDSATGVSTVTWNDQTIPAQGSKEFKFTVTTDKLDDNTDEMYIINVAYVNKMPTQKTEHLVKKPHIVATKTAEPADQVPYYEVYEGGYIKYVITVHNDGVVYDENVKVRDQVPAGTRFDPYMKGASPADVKSVVIGGPERQYIEWTIPRIEAGGSYELWFIVSVDEIPDDQYEYIIKNTAYYGQGGDEPTTPTNETHHKVTKAHLEIEKYADPAANSPVRVGQTVTYTIKVTNTGTKTAGKTIITDVVPEGTEPTGEYTGFNSGSASYDPATKTYTWNEEDIRPGTSRYVSFTVKVTEAALELPDQTIINVGKVNDKETNPVEHPVQPKDVVAVKSATPQGTAADGLITDADTKVHPGDIIEYKITVTNNNDVAVKYIPVSDTIPYGSSFVADENSPNLGGSYDSANNRISWLIPELKAKGDALGRDKMELTFKVKVDPLAAGELTTGRLLSNSAHYGKGGGTAEDPGLPDYETNTIEHIVVPKQIGGEKSAVPSTGSTIAQDTTITYTIVATNDTTETLYNVLVTDTLDEKLDESSVVVLPVTSSDGDYRGAIDYASRTVSWIVPVLPGKNAAGTPGNSQAMSFTVMPKSDATGDILNVAYVDGSQTTMTRHTIPGGPVDTDPTPRLNIDKSSPTEGQTVKAGETISYTIRVWNSGTETAQNVVITDTLPAGLTTTENLTWNIGSLPAGEENAVTRSFTATVGTSDSTRSLVNTAKATASNASSVQDSTTHTQTVDTPSTQEAKFHVVKGADPTPGETVEALSEINYTITVYNDDTENALSGVTVTDTVPLGTRYVSGGDYSYSTGLVSFELPEIAKGGHAEVSFTVQVLGNYSPIENIALARKGTVVEESNPVKHLVDTDDNSNLPVLKLEKTVKGNDPAEGTEVKAGDVITYQLKVTNVGGATAHNVIMSDVLPLGVTSSSQLSWQLGDLAPGASSTKEVTVTVGRTATERYLTNTAKASADECQTVYDNVTHLQNPSTRDFEVKKTALAPYPANSVVPVNEQITYQITVTNKESAALTDVKVTDQVPVGTSYVSATGGTSRSYDEGTGIVSYTIDSLPANGSATVTLTVKVVGGVDTITNIAYATADNDTKTSDPVNHVIEDEDVVPPQFNITKTANKANNTAVENGETLTYTIKVLNNTDEAMTGATVKDTLPDGIKLGAGDVTIGKLNGVDGTLSGKVITWSGVTLEVGENTVTVAVQVDGSTSPIINNASVTWNSVTDNADPTYHYVAKEPASELEISKSADKADFTALTAASPDVVYTIRVRNKGTEAATGVRIVDTIPAGMTLVSNGTTQDYGFTQAGNTLSWTIDSLEPSSTATAITIHVRANLPVEEFTVYRNRATVNGTETNDVIHVANPTPAPEEPLVKIIKSVSSIDAAARRVSFKLYVVNIGGATAQSAVVSDTLPGELSYVSASPAPTSNASGLLTWSIGDLDAGDSRTITVVTSYGEADEGKTVTNVGYVNGDNFPEDRDEVDVPLPDDETPPQQALSIEKTSTPYQVNEGESITYTIRLINNTVAPITGVRVQDYLPARIVRLTSISNDGQPLMGNGCALGVLWTNLTVPVGGLTLTIVAETGTSHALYPVSASSEILTNEVRAEYSGGTVSDTADNLIIFEDTPEQALSIEKTSTPYQVAAYGTIYYTIKITNNSAAPVTGVSVSDPLPTTLSDVSNISNGGTLVNGSIIWSNLTVPVSGLTLSFNAKALPTIGGPGSFTITNGASLSYPGGTGYDSVDNLVTGNSNPITVSKAADRSTAKVNDEILYTVTINNNGSTAPTDLTFIDTIPANTEFVENSVTVNGSPRNVTVNSANQLVISGLNLSEAGGTIVVKFKVKALVNGVTVTNIANVRVDDTVYASNPVDVTITDDSVEPNIIYAVKRAVTADGSEVVGKDDTITYYVDVYNYGPKALADAIISDTVPAALSIVSSSLASNAKQNGQTITWTLSNLPVSNGSTPSATVSFRATVNALPNGTHYRVIENKATVFAGGKTIVTDPTHNYQYDTTNTSALEVHKWGSEVGYVREDSQITYTISVKNTGSTAIDSYTVMDAVPNGTQAVAVNNGGRIEGGYAVWNLGNLAPNGTVYLSFTVKVLAGNGAIRNTAFAYTGGGSPSYSETVINEREGDSGNSFTISKSADKSRAANNEDITYTITVRNTGNTAINEISVYDTLPAYTAYKSSTPAYAAKDGNSLTWKLYAIPAGETKTVTVTATVKLPSGFVGTASLLNYATGVVTGDEGNGKTAGPVTVIVGEEQPGTDNYLRVTKLADRTTVRPDGTITYTILVQNLGSNSIANVTVRDYLPSNVTLVSASPSATNENGILTWQLDSLAPGAQRITVAVKVSSGAGSGALVGNIVSATAPGQQGGTDSATVVVTTTGDCGCGGNGGDNCYCDTCNCPDGNGGSCNCDDGNNGGTCSCNDGNNGGSCTCDDSNNGGNNGGSCNCNDGNNGGTCTCNDGNDGNNGGSCSCNDGNNSGTCTCNDGNGGNNGGTCTCNDGNGGTGGTGNGTITINNNVNVDVSGANVSASSGGNTITVSSNGNTSTVNGGTGSGDDSLTDRDVRDIDTTDDDSTDGTGGSTSTVTYNNTNTNNSASNSGGTSSGYGYVDNGSKGDVPSTGDELSVIMAAVMGGAALLVTAVLVYLLIMRRKKQRESMNEKAGTESMENTIA
jgi:uncharacterized repeat protein (TIGR01451 family)/fimbrial isopeptide formation D2 family protein